MQDLYIYNSSPLNINISLSSVAGEKVYVDKITILPFSSTKIPVKGGTKMLTVIKNTVITWRGIIPSNINSPIYVFLTKVIYKDRELINLLYKKSAPQNYYSTLLWICILIAIFILTVLLYKSK